MISVLVGYRKLTRILSKFDVFLKLLRNSWYRSPAGKEYAWHKHLTLMVVGRWIRESGFRFPKTLWLTVKIIQAVSSCVCCICSKGIDSNNNDCKSFILPPCWYLHVRQGSVFKDQSTIYDLFASGSAGFLCSICSRRRKKRKNSSKKPSLGCLISVHVSDVIQ